MRLKILIFFLGLSSFSFSQACVWARSGNGNYLDYGSATASDKDGNVFVTGTFASTNLVFGTYTLTKYGNGNVYIVKYDPNGNVLWAKSGISTGNDAGLSVAVDKWGNAFITGCFTNTTIAFDSFTLTNTGQPGSDLYLVKYDPNGNVIWAKSEGGYRAGPQFGNEVPWAVSTDSLGNAFVTGYSTSTTLTVGSYTIINPNPAPDYSLRAFLIKYDSGGNVLWAKGVNGLCDSYAGTTDLAGNSYISGGFTPSVVIGAFTLTTLYHSFFLAKYDSNGNVLWAKAEDVDYGFGMCTNAAGEVFVTGMTSSSLSGVGSYTFSNIDVFLAKYDTNGNVLWAKGLATNGNYGYGVATDATNVYWTGRFNNSVAFGNYTLTAPPGSTDPMYFTRFDLNGNFVWATAFTSGGGGGNAKNGVCTDKNGNVFIAGDFKTTPFFFVGLQSLPQTGTRNIFVAKYHFDNVGIKENEEENTFQLFPNPANDLLSLNFSGKEFERGEIINSIGQLVKTIDVNHSTEKTEISVKNLKEGIYILKLYGGNSQTVSKRFIIAR